VSLHVLMGNTVAVSVDISKPGGSTSDHYDQEDAEFHYYDKYNHFYDYEDDMSNK